ncbi:BatD family protein [Oceaniglobus roseus]|uniref:BatD family protein n=1 Tax=Oceaniglobus roseus TaxID=1737570 RepID=UPI0013000A53|nr:BatD family protein [Kandeliimicrobium roseum]
MIRLMLCLLLLATGATAQTLAVDPADLTLEVQVEEMAQTPFVGEMVLVTIHGVYKRHITREKLIQPKLDGMNWMQLGEDHWYESMIDGRPVKNMRRRIAVFPDRAGKLEIGAFEHRLTLLDEANRWFEYSIHSAPVTFEVAEPPAVKGWWFPVRNLEISDSWSNPPDQLKPGEGVLRVIRVAALGASPDMLPPMPELTSPSGLVFAHPEKRLVNLTPYGPEAIAFWRWTITPTNARSAILEPIRVGYFDTRDRQQHEVVISPQRVAFEEGTPPPAAVQDRSHAYVALQARGLLAIAALALLAGVAMALWSHQASAQPAIEKLRQYRLRVRLLRAARRGDAAAVRALARQLDRAAPANAGRAAVLHELDRSLFGKAPEAPDLGVFRRRFVAALRP